MLFFLFLLLPESTIQTLVVSWTLLFFEVFKDGRNVIFALVLPYAEQTVVLVPKFVLDLKLPTRHRFIACYILGYPAAIIMNQLPFGYWRHFYTIILTMTLQQYMIGVEWIHTLVTCLVTYLLLVMVPTRYITWVVPIFLYAYLLTSHYYNLMGVTLQMTLTQKLTSLTYNIYDGYILKQQQQQQQIMQEQKESNQNNNNGINKNKSSKQSSSSSRRSREQHERMVAMKCADWAQPNVPNILEYLGYIFCFSNFITGPAYEFAIYKNAIWGNNLRHTKAGEFLPRPSNVGPTLKPLMQGLALLWLHAKVSSYYSYRKLTHDSVTTLSPYIWRFVYLNMSCIPVRTHFYAPWKLAEGSNNLWYAGFDGFGDGENPLGWTNAQNVDIYQLEVASLLSLNVDFSNLSKTWNMKTSNYLKRYMYYRSNGSLAYTYFMSALWHGFYPGFFAVGICVTFFTYCERLARKRVDRLVAKIPPCTWKRRIADILLFLPYYYILPYFIQQGWSRKLDKMMIFWKSHYFYGHISMLLFFLIYISCAIKGGGVVLQYNSYQKWKHE